MNKAGPLFVYREAISRHDQIVREQFAPLSEIQFNWKNNNSTWSIGQCIQHINMLGRHWVKQLDQLGKTGIIAGTDGFQPGKAGRYAMKPYRSEKFKWRVPGIRTRFMPHFNVYTVGCINEFIEIQGRLLSLSDSLSKLDLNKNGIRMQQFPFLKMKLGDALELVTMHAAYFINYAQRIRELKQFPIS